LAPELLGLLEEPPPEGRLLLAEEREPPPDERALPAEEEREPPVDDRLLPTEDRDVLPLELLPLTEPERGAV